MVLLVMYLQCKASTVQLGGRVAFSIRQVWGHVCFEFEWKAE